MDPLRGSSPNPTPKSRQIYGLNGKSRALEGSGAEGVMGRGANEKAGWEGKRRGQKGARGKLGDEVKTVKRKGRSDGGRGWEEQFVSAFIYPYLPLSPLIRLVCQNQFPYLVKKT